MSAASEICDQRSAVDACKSDATTQHKQLSTCNPTARETFRSQLSTSLHIALLTGGSDRPYVLGLVEALTSVGSSVDVIGSDELSLPDLLDNSRVNFLNLRGDQSPDAPFARKIARVIAYYGRLICYAATAKPKVFHILWNNKFELFDRTLLLLYYK